MLAARGMRGRTIALYAAAEKEHKPYRRASGGIEGRWTKPPAATALPANTVGSALGILFAPAPPRQPGMRRHKHPGLPLMTAW